MSLSGQLQKLGVKSAFGPGANFARMAAEGLWISQVYHKSFLMLDENGAEAAAATASVMMRDGDATANIFIDHPFLIAIQDCPSGACLFLGRVTDPR
jgi:serpin B